MTKRINSLLWLIAITVVLFASQIEVAAQAKIHRYEVLENGSKLATVTTSVSNERVKVAVQRQGKLTHNYNAYVQLPATDVQLGNRTLFTIYHKTGDILAQNFRFNIAQEKGLERQKHFAVKLIRKQLAEDMRVLRAVREYNKTADTLLAELAYVILTYDDSIVDGQAPTTLLVTEVAHTSSAARTSTDRKNEARIMRTSMMLRAQSTSTSNQNSLEGCLNRVEEQFRDCKADTTFTDKSSCHNTRSSGTASCYSTYGTKEVAPVAPPEN